MNEALTVKIVETRAKKHSPKPTKIKANIITYHKPPPEAVANEDDDDDLN